VGWFPFWRKRRILTPYNDAEVVEIPKANVEESVDEGLMIAEYAVRMKLKNEIAVSAVVLGDDYEAKDFLPDAAAAFDELAAQSQQDADRLGEELAHSRDRTGHAQHVHDYRRGDEPNVRHRLLVATEAAGALRQKAHEEEYLLGLIEKARQDSWNEMSASLVDHALQYTPDAPEQLSETDRDVELATLRAELDALVDDGATGTTIIDTVPDDATW
jgi:hypothetical protein